jgi:hypothetical protein
MFQEYGVSLILKPLTLFRQFNPPAFYKQKSYERGNVKNGALPQNSHGTQGAKGVSTRGRGAEARE